MGALSSEISTCEAQVIKEVLEEMGVGIELFAAGRSKAAKVQELLTSCLPSSHG